MDRRHGAFRDARREAARGWEPASRLRDGPALLLDGALGTELERRGAPCGLPLWTSEALRTCPERVRDVHRDHAAAGAEVLTAATFRTQRRTLARGGLAHADRALTALAVALAREGRDAAGVAPETCRVAGSAPPLEDCYRPDRVPDDAALASEHRRHAELLAEAGVDLVLCETHHTVREAVAAVRAGRATALPVVASFVCGPDARLLSGERLADAVAALRPLAPAAVAVNCLPLDDAAACIGPLAASGLPFGAWPNLGAPTASGWSAGVSPAGFAAALSRWLEAGAHLVGGCCGTRPGHVAAMARHLGRTVLHG